MKFDHNGRWIAEVERHTYPQLPVIDARFIKPCYSYAELAVRGIEPVTLWYIIVRALATEPSRNAVNLFESSIRIDSMRSSNVF